MYWFMFMDDGSVKLDMDSLLCNCNNGGGSGGGNSFVNCLLKTAIDLDIEINSFEINLVNKFFSTILCLIYL